MQVGLAGNMSSEMLGKAIHRQVPCLSKDTQESCGKGCLWTCALLAAPCSEALRGVLQKPLAAVGHIKLQDVGSSTASPHRSQVPGKLHQAGIWQVRHTRTWERNPFSLRGPSLYNDNT